MYCLVFTVLVLLFDLIQLCALRFANYTKRVRSAGLFFTEFSEVATTVGFYQHKVQASG